MSSFKEKLIKIRKIHGLGPYVCIVCKKEYIPVGSKANIKGLCRLRCGETSGTPPRGKIKKISKLSDTTNKDFYSSRSWRELRYKVLKKYERKCMLCGSGPKTTILHVDHIRPISLYPQLRLDFENLQVLCEPCNLGKSNKDETDWR